MLVSCLPFPPYPAGGSEITRTGPAELSSDAFGRANGALGVSVSLLRSVAEILVAISQYAPHSCP